MNLLLRIETKLTKFYKMFKYRRGLYFIADWIKNGDIDTEDGRFVEGLGITIKLVIISLVILLFTTGLRLWWLSIFVLVQGLIMTILMHRSKIKRSKNKVMEKLK